MWADAVGEAIAGEAGPTSERGGILTVSCSAAVWAQELDLMAPVILERLNRSSAGRTRLRCVSVPPRAALYRLDPAPMLHICRQMHLPDPDSRSLCAILKPISDAPDARPARYRGVSMCRRTFGE